MKKLRTLVEKYREPLVYLLVGGLTTLVAALARFGVNLLCFGAPSVPSFRQNTVLSLVDWTAGVAFAYPTNRRFVFRSKNPRILTEAAGFVGSRLSTLGLDWALTQLMGTVLGLNVYVVWFVKTAVVFAANYFLSKLFVFRKKS